MMYLAGCIHEWVAIHKENWMKVHVLIIQTCCCFTCSKMTWWDYIQSLCVVYAQLHHVTSGNTTCFETSDRWHHTLTIFKQVLFSDTKWHHYNSDSRKVTNNMFWNHVQMTSYFWIWLKQTSCCLVMQCEVIQYTVNDLFHWPLVRGLQSILLGAWWGVYNSILLGV